MAERSFSTVSNLRNAFRFAQWASSQPKPPTKLQIMDFLQCTGITAKRWRKAWLDNLPNPFLQPPSGGNRAHPHQDKS